MKQVLPVLVGLIMAVGVVAETEPTIPTYLSATLEDVAIQSGGGTVEVTLELLDSGSLVARETRALDTSGGATSARGVTASVRTATPEFLGHDLEARVLVGDVLALTVLGRPEQAANETGGNRTVFRVGGVQWPAGSPLEPTGPRLVTFRSGWTSDEVLVGFTPTENRSLASPSILLEAWEPSADGARRDIMSQIGPATLSPRGNLLAAFDLDYLPPSVFLRASLRTNDSTVATVWKELDFPARKSWGSGLDPGSPPMVTAGGIVNDVRDQSTAVTVPSAVLNPIPTESRNEVAPGFSGVEGGEPSSLAWDLFGPPKPAAPTTATDAAKLAGDDSGDQGKGEAPTSADLGRVALLGLGIVALLLLAALVVLPGRRRRSKP